MTKYLVCSTTFESIMGDDWAQEMGHNLRSLKHMDVGLKRLEVWADNQMANALNFKKEKQILLLLLKHLWVALTLITPFALNLAPAHLYQYDYDSLILPLSLCRIHKLVYSYNYTLYVKKRIWIWKLLQLVSKVYDLIESLTLKNVKSCLKLW